MENNNGKQVLSAKVLKETLQPAIGLPNTLGEALGFWELLNPAYGMGRQTVSYRGHLLTFHRRRSPRLSFASLLHAQRQNRVIVLVISDHSAPLYNIVGYNIYERLLGMDQTPWSERQLKMRLANKKPAPKHAPRPAATACPTPSHRTRSPTTPPNTRAQRTAS